MHDQLIVICLFPAISSFLVSVLKGELTFGGLEDSTVPALLILLISGLVSWRI